MGSGESLPALLFESARHAPWLAGLGLLGLAFLAWTTLRLRELGGWRWPALLLKFTGVALLVFCLLEPLLPSRRPVAGANIFAVVVDSSRSMTLEVDPEGGGVRAESIREALGATLKPGWLDRLETQFKVHRYAFGERLRRFREPGELEFADRSSALGQALDEMRRRYEGQPLAGALVWSDGALTTGSEETPWPPGFPVYTLFTGAEPVVPDAALIGVSVRESAFEDAPVTLGADAVLLGCTAGREAEVRFLDESDRLYETRRVTASGPVHKETVHVQVKPETRGITGFRVEIVLAGGQVAEGNGGLLSPQKELTVENNRLFAVADLRTGPYPILYVTGRPNWEYKFLRRALREDKDLELAALIRIARREPKFEWKSRDGERTNPLFRGFGKDPEETGDYDQPVLIRQDTKDETELAGGFPTKDPDLFGYTALILDDIESSFFTFEQLEAMERFVSRRGGGLVMLGGIESFQRGGYAGGPLEALLPVYLNPPGRALPETGAPYELTQEGLVSPWARLRLDAEAEQNRLDRMPGFLVVNRLGIPKPGASLISRFRGIDGHSYPALVSQSYGRGRSVAIGIGDVWRWGFRDPEQRPDMDRFWRQLVRWLVVDAPRRVEIETALDDGRFPAVASIRVTVHDEEYQKDSDVRVKLVLTRPSADEVEVVLEPAADAPGVFEGSHICYEPGIYRVKAEAETQDARAIGAAETGWAFNPGAQELSKPGGDRAALERIASETDGSVVLESELDQLVDSLTTREAPVMETVTRPIWHLPAFLLLAIGAFVGEWGIRRWKGVP